MKINHYILTLLFTAFSLQITSFCNAQIADSIKYENGFLYYHEYGSKNLPPVIVLTGGPGNSYNQLAGLAETISSNYRSILLEQRGTGRSIPYPFDSTTVNLNAVTRDIRTLMDSLELKRSVIVGHSWGGMLAMKFASDFPDMVSHLILVAPGPHKEAQNGFNVLFTNRRHTRSFEEEQRLNQLNELISKNNADSLEVMESAKLARRAYIFANPIPDSIFHKINSESNSKTSRLLLNDIYSGFDVSESLKRYSGKIDVITGRQDVVGFCSYELKEDIANAKVHWINECGHFPMYEQPREFYRILYTALGEE